MSTAFVLLLMCSDWLTVVLRQCCSPSYWLVTGPLSHHSGLAGTPSSGLKVNPEPASLSDTEASSSGLLLHLHLLLLPDPPPPPPKSCLSSVKSRRPRRWRCSSLPQTSGRTATRRR